MKEKTLYRSCKNRILGGVCGGLGEYFEIDPVLIRLILALLIFTGVSIIFYFLAWIIIPEDPNCGKKTAKSTDGKEGRETASEIKGDHWKKNDDGRSIVGIVVIALGVLLLFQNTIGFRAWDIFWPLVLVIVGLFFIFRAKGEK